MSFWRWPGKWEPHSIDKLTAHLDVLPTLCELAGITIPEKVESNLEGFSLVPLLQSSDPISWHEDRLLFQHVARWPAGMAASHKYAMCGVRQGHYLLIRSEPCKDPACLEQLSQCTALRRVQEGAEKATYTEEDAQIHWGVTEQGRWSLFNTKYDPACINDLASVKEKVVHELAKAYDDWWEAVFPSMIESGGDIGDFRPVGNF